MSVGVPSLDGDHRLLMDLVNRLETGIRTRQEAATLAEHVDSFIAFSEFHLAREEKVMEACGYPGLPREREEHARFLHDIYALRDRYLATHESVVFDNLLCELRHWVDHHVSDGETGLRPFAEHNERAHAVAAAFHLDCAV
jgi:hemerythrin-like metal-binding protein